MRKSGSGRALPAAFALACIVLVATLSSCARAAPGASKGGSLSFAITGDIVALDPAQAYDFTTNPVVNEITEGLLRFSPTGELLPNLAEKWESPDPKTYVYHLRKGVKFQDGSAMGADDVVFSLDRIRDPKTASSLAWMYGSVDRIERTDDSTVRISLKTPDAMFRYALATTAGHVISKAYYEAHASNFGKPEGGLLGTGPFKFASWKPGSEIVVERFDGYWDRDKGPFLDRVVFKIIGEDATRVTGLKTGEIDATIKLPVDLLPVVRSIKGAQLVGVEGLSDDWIAFNTRRKPLDDPQVRKAIITAFNVGAVMDGIVKEAGVAAGNQSVGPALWTYEKAAWETFQNTVEKYAYDPARARELLAKSRGAGGFKAKILTDGDAFRVNVAQALQADLAKLGIQLEIEKVGEAELTTRQFSGKRDYDIVMGGWGADFPDPAANIQPFLHSSGMGEGGSDFAVYSNPKVDALIDQQSRSSDDKERAKLLISALQLAAADAPYIFVDHPKIFYAASEKVGGYTMSPIWYWDSIARGMYLKK